MTSTGTTSIEAVRRRFGADLQTRIPQHFARMAWSSEQIASHQRKQLRRLLAYAIERSPFHARRLKGIEPESFELDDLASLPTMTKAEMMAAWDDVVTDRRLTLRTVEAHIESLQDVPVPFAGEFLCVTSGGSSGVRSVWAYDWEAVLDTLAVSNRGIGAGLLASGKQPPESPVVASVAAPTVIHGTRAYTAIAEGGPVRVVNAPVTLPLPEITARLNEGQPNSVLSYPSVMASLAAEQRAGRLRISPIVITTTAEALTPEVSDEIETAFDALVVNLFGSCEGVNGASLRGADPIVFASDLAIIEPVDEDNRPVPAGTPSAKVLVTNLFNLTQPIIRYELADSFVRMPDDPGHGHLVATVRGRSDEVFTYGSLRIHPLTLRSPLVATRQVSEYQVRQTGRGIDVDVVARGLDEQGLRQRLAGALSSAGLQDAEVTVRVVAAIHRNLQTGKVRRFVPLPVEA